MKEILFNHVIVVDLLPEGEDTSARRVHSDLQDARDYKVDLGSLTVDYRKIADIKQFNDLIKSEINAVKNGHHLPMLHIEAHGYDDYSGIEVADGTSLSWTQLTQDLTPLNIAMGLRLFVVFANCWGGLVNALKPRERAAVWGYIGPLSKIDAGQLQVDFSGFYTSFFETQSTQEAMMKLNGGNPKKCYVANTARHCFIELWKNWLAKENISRGTNPDVLLKYRTYFEEVKRHHFMFDIIPENVDRFRIEFDDLI